jgi:hypothetical protein
MHTWWNAVCDEHKETCGCFINSPVRTLQLLCGADTEIVSFFDRHWNCSLRLVHKDEDLDHLHDNGYTFCTRAGDPETADADPRVLVERRQTNEVFCSHCGVSVNSIEFPHEKWCNDAIPLDCVVYEGDSPISSVSCLVAGLRFRRFYSGDQMVGVDVVHILPGQKGHPLHIVATDRIMSRFASPESRDEFVKIIMDASEDIFRNTVRRPGNWIWMEGRMYRADDGDELPIKDEEK